MRWLRERSWLPVSGGGAALDRGPGHLSREIGQKVQWHADSVVGLGPTRGLAPPRNLLSLRCRTLLGRVEVRGGHKVRSQGHGKGVPVSAEDRIFPG